MNSLNKVSEQPFNPNCLQINLPRFLDNTIDDIELFRKKIFETISIASDYGRLKSLSKIQAKLLERQKILATLSSDNTINTLKDEIELYSKDECNLEKIRTLNRIILEIENTRNSKKFNIAGNDISEVLNQVKYAVECLNKTAFDVQKVLTMDFKSVLILLNENIEIQKQKIAGNNQFRTNQERLKYLLI